MMLGYGDVGKSLNIGSTHTFWILTLPCKTNKPKGTCKVFGLPSGKCLHKDIRSHVFCRTGYNLNLTTVDHVADEVISNINVLCSRVELTLHVSKCNWRLVIQVERD